MAELWLERYCVTRALNRISSDEVDDIVTFCETQIDELGLTTFEEMSALMEILDFVVN